MKRNGLGQYFIAGGVTAVIALAAGGLFAFSIYSSDRKKERAQDAVPPGDPDEKEEETDRETD